MARPAALPAVERSRSAVPRRRPLTMLIAALLAASTSALPGVALAGSAATGLTQVTGSSGRGGLHGGTDPPAGLTSLTAAPVPTNLPFSPDRHDYVLRCEEGEPVTITGSVAPGEQVRAIALGPSAPPPSLLQGSFSTTMTSPGTTAVRLEVGSSDAPATISATYHVRCLPPSLPPYTVTVSGTPQASHYLVTWGTFIVVFDAEGTPVWWLDQAPRRPIDAKVIGGHLVASESGGDHYVFRDWDGTVVRTVGHVTDHHDLQRLPDGRLVGFEYVTSDRGFAEEARFFALDDAGDEVWVWRTEDHIDPSERVAAPYKSDNFAHVNAVEPDGDGGVVFSARSLDALYDVDLGTGEIRWKLGGTDRPESLRVSDGTRLLDPSEVVNLFAGQHDPRFWPDGTLSVMDNGSSDVDRRPRLLRFALDLEARVATAIEVVSDPRAAYSGGTGSARRLSGGNWVATWGLPTVNRYFTELTPSGEPVLTVDGVGSYRVVPFQPGDLDPDELRAGMDTMAGTPTGVTGTVVDSVSGAPVAGAGVALLDRDDLSLARAVVTGADGGFAATVPPGTYLVYLLETSGNHRSGFRGSPTPVVVGPGAPTDVVAAMDPLRGAVSGTVTEDGSGAPVPGAWTLVLDATSGRPVVGATADGTGGYSTGPLPVGTYRTVHVDPSATHAPRFHGGTADAAGALPVTVTAGGSTVADVALPTQEPHPGGATVSGHVTGAPGGEGLAGVWVLALSTVQYSLMAATATDQAGAYALAVPPGDYKVLFVDPRAGHVAEWHDGHPLDRLADAESVTAPTTVDATLAASTGRLTGSVSGTPTGKGLAGVWVVAIGATGLAGGALTAPDGSYTMGELVPGTYRVTFVDPTGTYRQTYAGGAATYDGAIPVPVSAGATTVADATLTP